MSKYKPRRTLKIRRASLNKDSVLALIAGVVIDKSDKQYLHPAQNSSFETKLNRKQKILLNLCLFF